MRKIYFVLLMGLATTAQSQTCFNAGTGADGAYHATSNTTISSGTYNFTSFTIDAGVTVQVTGSVPLDVHCTGNVNINGILQANGGNGNDGVTYTTFGIGGMGVAGGANGGDGSFASGAGPFPGIAGNGTGAGGIGDGWSGGGGAGYSAPGSSSGGVGGTGGPDYGNIYISGLEAGSGGGGGSGGYDCGAGGGGGGGGVIVINSAGNITISATGSIQANGGNGGSDGTGSCGGGGGGSGGSLWLATALLDNNGSIQAKGGLGGASTVSGTPYYGEGGNGADGRIRLDVTAFGSTGTFIPSSGYTTALLSSSTINVSDVTCHGNADGVMQASPAGGVGPYSYVWSTTETTSVIFGLVAGNYSVTITGADMCSATISDIVNEPTVLIATGSNTPETTAGAGDGTASVVASGGTPPYMYTWAPGGGTTATITGLSTGNYTCSVTDANGCNDMEVVIVTVTTGIAGAVSSISSVYPNPVTNLLNIEMQNSGVYQVTLVNSLGETVHTQNFTGTKAQLNTSALSRGVYLYRVSGNNLSATGTLIKE